VFYAENAKLPSGFATNAREKRFFSLAEAEAAGINLAQSDEVTATGGNVEITLAGGAGEVVSITINEGDGVITLAEYEIQTGDNAAAIAVGLRASMNDVTFQNLGYSAAGSGANVLITAPVGLGEILNGSVLAFNDGGGTATATVTQFSGGVQGVIDVMHYQIKEYFRMQPKGVVYVGIYDESAVTLTEVVTLQNFAAGEIKQMGVFNQTATWTSGDITALQAAATTLANADRPLSVLYCADMVSLNPPFTNITTLTAPRVSNIVAGDGRTNVRNTDLSLNVFNTKTFSVGNLGAALGSVSFVSVHESIAWVGKVNISDGVNMETVKILPATQLSTASESLLNTLNAYGHIFVKKYDGLAGSYFDNQKTAVTNASDFARIANNRVMDKAIRLIRLRLLPLLSSPLYVNTDGTLSEATMAVFANECDQIIGGRFGDDATGQMVIDGEISAGRTIIDPTQNVLSTGRVDIAIEIIPVGEAETIRVTIGFVAQFNS